MESTLKAFGRTNKTLSLHALRSKWHKVWIQLLYQPDHGLERHYFVKQSTGFGLQSSSVWIQDELVTRWKHWENLIDIVFILHLFFWLHILYFDIYSQHVLMCHSYLLRFHKFKFNFFWLQFSFSGYQFLCALTRSGLFYLTNMTVTLVYFFKKKQNKTE